MEGIENVDTADTADAGIEGSESLNDGNILETVLPEDASQEVQDAIKEMYKVQINGQEGEVDLDELRKGYQTAKSAQEKFREAETLKKQMAYLPEYLKSNPIEALKHVGIDFNELAEGHVLKQAEYEMLDENERRAVDAETLAEQREKELQFYRQKQEEQEHNSRVDTFSQKIQEGLQNGGLPTSKKMMGEVARELEFLWNTGNAQATPDDAVQALKQKRHGLGRETVSGLSVQDIIEALGPEKLKELRNHDLEKLNKGNFYNQDLKLSEAKPFEKNKKGITKEDWKNHLRMIENM